MLEGEYSAVVTGGAGFIGSHLVERLLEDGAEVLVVDDLSAGRREHVPDAASFEDVELQSAASREAVEAFDPDLLVHLAAVHYIPYCQANPHETFRVNVMGTRNLYRAAENCPSLDRVVFASSAAVYPPEDTAHAETDTVGPMDVYGETKVVGEELTELFARRTGVPAAALRLFNVYGERETNDHLIPEILEQVGPETDVIRLGNLTPARDFVHVTDVARAFHTAARRHDDGFRTYNVGTGTEHTVQAVAERIREVTGTGFDIEQESERKRESDRPHLRADVSRIDAELDWRPEFDFTAGLERLAGQQR